MKKKYLQILFIPCIVFICIPNAFGIEYKDAYNICSPVAHQLAKVDCNYGRVFEKFYIQCMNVQGYRDDDENPDPGFYRGYLEAYRYCSSHAQQNTKEYCAYGRLYNKHYNKCMLKHNFNEYGEKIIRKEYEQHQFEFNF